MKTRWNSIVLMVGLVLSLSAFAGSAGIWNVENNSTTSLSTLAVSYDPLDIPINRELHD